MAEILEFRDAKLTYGSDNVTFAVRASVTAFIFTARDACCAQQYQQYGDCFFHDSSLRIHWNLF